MNEIPWYPLSSSIFAHLCCPCCKYPLNLMNQTLFCSNDACKKQYPIINEIPILINEEKSIFTINSYRIEDAIKAQLLPRLNLYHLLPSISLNINSRENFKQFGDLLSQGTSVKRTVLIIGGRITGNGMSILYLYPDIEIISSDIAFGPRTQLICDAHDIPFPDNFFDGVVIQAVLEHVIDPQRVVDEIYRVLKPNGIVYAETPFMQQVHEGRYDFMRFTHLGHRRLFRWFKEIQSGPTGGPGMALAWSIRYFLLSFSKNQIMRSFLGGIARVIAFFWKYFDPLLATKPGIYDAASGFFFLGRKNNEPLSDRELIKLYRGAIQ